MKVPKNPIVQTPLKIQKSSEIQQVKKRIKSGQVPIRHLSLRPTTGYCCAIMSSFILFQTFIVAKLLGQLLFRLNNKSFKYKLNS